MEDMSSVMPLALESHPEKLNGETDAAKKDNNSRRDAEGKSQSISGIEELMKDSTFVASAAPEKTQATTTMKPKANTKDDILNLFDQVCLFACLQESYVLLFNDVDLGYFLFVLGYTRYMREPIKRKRTDCRLLISSFIGLTNKQLIPKKLIIISVLC